MRWSVKIGTIAGIRVELHVTFLIFIGWIALASGLSTRSPIEAITDVVGILLVFGCVLLHELGHALAARRYGLHDDTVRRAIKRSAASRASRACPTNPPKSWSWRSPDRRSTW